jgi:hypothetical protein
MDVSTRPSKKHRQAHALHGCVLAVFLFLGSTAPARPAPTPETLDPLVTQSVANDTSHEIAITTVRPGEEHLALVARLTTMSSNIAKDVAWTIRSSEGDKQVETIASTVDHPVIPGTYEIEARYGSVLVRERITVPEGASIEVNFILNAGALRVLPTIKDAPPSAAPSQALVFALSGRNKGKLIAKSNMPGELLRLTAGTYRVETRMGNSNAVTDVRVRPGTLSAIDVAHVAGVARLQFVGDAQTDVRWLIHDDTGSETASANGVQKELALKPGAYTAEAHVNGVVLTTKFLVNAGEALDITLGN